MVATTTTTLVYNNIRSKIIKGELSPNENLTEMELANQYGVSRNTVKKALLMLERENLVTIELNKGTKVRAYSLDEVLEYLEVRATLEGFIVNLAVPVITGEQINALEEIMSEMCKNKEQQNLVEYSKCNQRFHEVIYEACPNRTLVDMTTSLKAQMGKYNTKTILIPGRDVRSLAEHTAVLEAIKAGEVALADALMRRHITNVRKTFEENYSLLYSSCLTY